MYLFTSLSHFSDLSLRPISLGMFLMRLCTTAYIREGQGQTNHYSVCPGKKGGLSGFTIAGLLWERL